MKLIHVNYASYILKFESNHLAKSYTLIPSLLSFKIIIYDSVENKETIMSRAGVEPAPYDLQSYALPSSPRDAKATLITLSSRMLQVDLGDGDENKPGKINS